MYIYQGIKPEFRHAEIGVAAPVMDRLIAVHRHSADETTDA